MFLGSVPVNVAEVADARLMWDQSICLEVSGVNQRSLRHKWVSHSWRRGSLSSGTMMTVSSHWEKGSTHTLPVFVRMASSMAVSCLPNH